MFNIRLYKTSKIINLDKFVSSIYTVLSTNNLFIEILIEDNLVKIH